MVVALCNIQLKTVVHWILRFTVVTIKVLVRGVQCIILEALSSDALVQRHRRAI